MRGPADMLRVWRTVRHLKPVQVWGRLRFRLSRPSVDGSPAPPLRPRGGPWREPAHRRPSMTGPSAFRLLGEERELDRVGWDDPSVAKLWRYNLHYFDDLCAAGAAERAHWHRTAVDRWIRENPPASGTGWEPYPASLRIVNWSKWMLAGEALSPEAAQSLAVQARWLRRRLEWHLLGNHLFVNAKALIFAGTVFDGPEAERWRSEGLAILREQVPEQVLGDGGQFELSPMYHALALEDMLDLLNLARAYPALGATWEPLVAARIPSMRHWLAAMTHPDGEVAFFNDSAIGVHPSPAELEAYALRLGLPAAPPPTDGCTALRESGFVRIRQGEAVLIVDVGRIGPDYLPGHAHADTLSFELSIGGRRVLVNSGTSEYGLGPERLRQRGTAAHNTVTIDGEDSSEVWGGFRVARRARPFGLSVSGDASGWRITCSHDGFSRLRGSPVHRRTWTLRPGCLSVEDEVEGPGAARSWWHWAPGISGRGLEFTGRDGVPTIRAEVSGGKWSTLPSTWHPEFGRIVSNEASIADFDGGRCSVNLRWT